MTTLPEPARAWVPDDPIFSRFSVWKKGADGKEALTPLSENNVGAVNLSPIASRFDQKGKENRRDGQVSTTGIYVDAEGNVKTIQQVDVTV